MLIMGRAGAGIDKRHSCDSIGCNAGRIKFIGMCKITLRHPAYKPACCPDRLAVRQKHYEVWSRRFIRPLSTI